MRIPRRALGFIYKQSPSAKSSLVTLTAYLDFTCQKSKRVYPVVLQLADKLYEKNFEFIIHPFSLPYHRNSHIITQAVHVINKNTNGTAVFPFIESVYNKLDLLSTDATRDKTDNQVLEILVPLATDFLPGMSSTNYIDELFKRSYDMAARLDFKYSCSRGILSTPTFTVNDVIIDASVNWSVQDWLSVIDPLL